MLIQVHLFYHIDHIHFIIIDITTYFQLMNDHPASLVPAFDSKVTLEDSHFDDVDDDGNDNDGGYKEREKSGCAKLQAQQAKTNKSFFCSCAHTKRPPSTYTNTIYLVIPQPKHGLQC